jgi:hypothetical protein
MMRARHAIAVGLTITLGAGGCSSGTERDRESVALTSGPALSPSDAVGSEASAPRLLSGSVQLSADEDALLRYAESVLTATCMSSKGFNYIPLDLEELKSSLNQSYRIAQVVAFPYDATVEGESYSDTVEPSIEDPNRDYLASLDEAQLMAFGDALQGFVTDQVSATALGITLQTPQAGCVSEARASLYGSLDSALKSLLVASNLGAVAHSMARSKPDVIASLAAWISCMSGMGYDVADFGQARALAQSQQARAGAIASADASCTVQTDLSAAYRAAYNSAVNDLIENDPGTFEEVRRTREAAISRAQNLLDG